MRRPKPGVRDADRAAYPAAEFGRGAVCIDAREQRSGRHRLDVRKETLGDDGRVERYEALRFWGLERPGIGRSDVCDPDAAFLPYVLPAKVEHLGYAGAGEAQEPRQPPQPPGFAPGGAKDAGRLLIVEPVAGALGLALGAGSHAVERVAGKQTVGDRPPA